MAPTEMTAQTWSEMRSNFFNVETADLTKEQQFKIALEQIQAREKRFTISAAVICFLTVVGAGAAAYAIVYGRNQDAPRGTLDTALVGSWESVGRFDNLEIQLQFVFNTNGWFSRRYISEEGGTVETAQADLKLKGSRFWPNYVFQYRFDSTDSLKLSTPGREIEFKRAGTSDYPQDALVGSWKTTLLIQGANWNWTIEIDRERMYHSHSEAHDEGRITAADTGK